MISWGILPMIIDSALGTSHPKYTVIIFSILKIILRGFGESSLLLHSHTNCKHSFNGYIKKSSLSKTVYLFIYLKRLSLSVQMKKTVISHLLTSKKIIEA